MRKDERSKDRGNMKSERNREVLREIRGPGNITLKRESKVGIEMRMKRERIGQER